MVNHVHTLKAPAWKCQMSLLTFYGRSKSRSREKNKRKNRILQSQGNAILPYAYGRETRDIWWTALKTNTIWFFASGPLKNLEQLSWNPCLALSKKQGSEKVGHWVGEVRWVCQKEQHSVCHVGSLRTSSALRR